MNDRPFELTRDELENRLEEMVDATFSDLVSEFLLMPIGNGFIRYSEFRDAYEVLKRCTKAFREFTEPMIKGAISENSRALGVLRAILGLTAPEWAELTHSEIQTNINQNAARTLDRKCRDDINYFQNLRNKHNQKVEAAKRTGRNIPEPPISLQRINALIKTAVEFVAKGAPEEQEGVIHRLSKFDTRKGLESLRYASSENVPYAVLLYERYLGRPFAGHRDAVSELVGEVMENAIEKRLRKAGVSYRKTGRAERIPGFGQAPDFCIPDEVTPVVIIEAKITSDDGTARDKVARIKELETQRNEHVASGRPHYEVVACIDGRGFRQRREDMRQLLLRLDGKVFTTASLDGLISNTQIKKFVGI